jgi:outer membrane lipoprotein LolB
MSSIERMSGFVANSRHAVLAFACLLLAGCIGLPATRGLPDAPPALIRQYQETLELAGRLSVHYQKDGKEEALHGGFSWRQNPQRTFVSIFSPLGQTIATIAMERDGATLTQAGQASRTATDVDMLTAEALGWPLPLAGMRYWLQGFGSDRLVLPFNATQRDSEFPLTTIDGWLIRYPVWQDEGGPSRPKRIDLARSTAHAGDVAIRIVIDTWQPN